MKQVRFLNNARGGEWHKGEVAEIERYLGFSNHDPPCEIYLVRKKNGEEVWAKSTEFEYFNQLKLFETEQYESPKT